MEPVAVPRPIPAPLALDSPRVIVSVSLSSRSKMMGTHILLELSPLAITSVSDLVS